MHTSQIWPLLLLIAIMVAAASPVQAAAFGRRELREALNSSVVAAQEADRVVALPGQPPVNFSMYAGYVTVDKQAGRAHYYYFVEAAEEPENKPLVFWFNGGPGCSSIAFGFGEEFGPFFINPGAQTLRLNPNAGNRVANVLFVDSPAGVGYSYSNTSNDLLTHGDNRTAHDNHAFVVNWLERFPQYKGRPFYLAGESYAGMYVPQLAKLIHENNKNLSANATINFKGFMVGNPLTERYYDFYWGRVDFLYSHSMISTRLYNQIKVVCNFTQDNQLNLSAPCINLLIFNISKEQGLIDPYSVYTDRCIDLRSFWGNISTSPVTPPYLLQAFDPCTYNYSETYFNRPDVQKAMHANFTGVLYPWTGCSWTVYTNWKDSEVSSLPIYRELLEAGYRLWVFSGDVDSVTPTIGTSYALESLNLPIAVPWYPWYNKQQVGGREIVYQGNLTFITVRGAGHEVPLLKPEEFLQIFGAFLNGSLLPSQPY